MTIQTHSDPHIVIIGDDDHYDVDDHHHQINQIAADLSLLEASMGMGGVVSRYHHHTTHTGHDDVYDSSYRSVDSDASSNLSSSYRTVDSDTSSNLSVCIDIDFPQSQSQRGRGRGPIRRRVGERRPSQDRLDELHQEVQMLIAANAEAAAAVQQQQQQQQQQAVSSQEEQEDDTNNSNNNNSTTRTRLMNFIMTRRGGAEDDIVDDDSFRINQSRLPRSSRVRRRSSLDEEEQHEAEDIIDDDDDDDFYGTVEIYHLESDNSLVPISQQESLSLPKSSSPAVPSSSRVPIMQPLQEASSEIMPRAA